MKRFLLYAALLYFSYHHLSRFTDRATDGLTIWRTAYHTTVDIPWEEKNPAQLSEQELSSLLDQRYTYLGSGGQCFAFLSEDGRTVLKLLRLQRLQPSLWMHLPIPSFLQSYKEKKLAIRTKRRERDFISYAIACDELSKETGTLFAQLMPKKRDWHTTIVDKLNIAHRIDLERPFILQSYGVPIQDYLSKLEVEGEIEMAEKALCSVFDLLIERQKKGIDDDDAAVYRNVGFLDNRPLLIDLGRFSHQHREISQERLAGNFSRLKSWLLSRESSLVNLIDQRIIELPEDEKCVE